LASREGLDLTIKSWRDRDVFFWFGDAVVVFHVFIYGRARYTEVVDVDPFTSRLR